MTLFAIKEAVASAIKAMLPSFKIYAKEVKEGAVKPYFSIGVVPASIDNGIFYKNISVTVTIKYYSKDETYSDVLDVASKLIELFNLTLTVGDRVLTLITPEIVTPEENGNDYLEFSFDLNYQNINDNVQIVGGRIDNVEHNQELGYTDDSIQLMNDLVINDEQEG